MDSRQAQNPYHLGNSEENLEHSTSAGFTGMVDEFLVFGGPDGFDGQLLARSLFELDSIHTTSGPSNGSNMLHTPMASRQQTSINYAQSNQCPASLSRPMSALDILGSPNDDRLVDRADKPRCWDHGCNGREFSSKSNLMRHMKEKSGASNKCCCPLCGAIFTRSSARDTHLAKQSCNKIRRYSNGRPRPSRLAVLENPRVAAVAAAAATSITPDQIQWQALEAIEWGVGSVGDLGSG